MPGDRRYDPWADEVMADPYPFYADLRARGGCVEVEDRDMWVVARYADVVDVLRDPDTFTSSAGVSRQAQPESSTWIGEDPPTHTETRRLAQPVLSRAGVSRHLEVVEARIEELVDEWVRAGGGDVVPLANRVATASVCRLLGLTEALDEMVAMAEDTFRAISSLDLPPDADGPTETQLRVGLPASDAIEQGRHSADYPADTIVAQVIQHAGERFGLTELDVLGRVTYPMALLSPGIETTRTMIGHAVDLAARAPEAWSDVVDGAVTADAYIDEVLRYEAPIQGFFRGAAVDADFGGARLPAGARVLCLFGSANRDDAEFDHADRFDPRRPDAGRHLSFGFGIHRCIGAWLALAEGVAAVRALAARVDGFEVLGAERRSDMALLRSWKRLEVGVARR